MPKKSNLQLHLEMWLQSNVYTDDFVTEYEFNKPVSNYRFDIAYPDQKLAVECDGLQWHKKSGHQSMTGVLNDRTKDEYALLAGWRVYRVAGPWILPQRSIPPRQLEVVETVATLLGRI